MKNILQNIAFVSLVFRYSDAFCSNVYGAPPCKYVPAPPGKIPSCARPGLPYCVDHPEYPLQQIKYLIETLQYDYSTLLTSETREEHRTYIFQPEYGPKYGPNTYNHDSYYRRPPSHYNDGYKYDLPSMNGRLNYSDNFVSYPYTRAPYRDSHSNNHHLTNNHIHYNTHGQYQPYNGHITSKMNYYDPRTWRRYRRSYREKRSLDKKDNSKNIKDEIHSRTKRQNALTSSEPLCGTQQELLTPQAAMTINGNFMFIVNFKDANTKYMQEVYVEKCILFDQVNEPQPCNSLCDLKRGYTSRCEQKYIQKRLVALKENGQKLVNEIFIFPSCCVCTLLGG